MDVEERAAVPVWLWAGVWLVNREGCPMVWGEGTVTADVGEYMVEMSCTLTFAC